MEIAFFNKWLHLLSIIGMLGGTAFAFLVLHPALKDRADDPEARAIWKKYGMVQMGLWVIVLLTGFYNQSIVGPTVIGKYQMFLGMKIMLAFLMFILAGLAAHSPPGMEKLTRNKGPWLAVILLMGIVAVGISAHLNMGRVSGEYKKPATDTAPPVSGAGASGAR